MQQTIRKSGIVLLAFLFAALMAFSAIPVHAASFDTTLTVKGVEAGNTVTGYQIVKDDGRGNWVVANTHIHIENPENPTAAEINKLAGQVKNLKLTEAQFTQQSNGDYTATAPAAGSYLVLVVNGNKANYVYSPMLISADYDGTNRTESLESDTANAKKTQPSVSKVIAEKNDTKVENAKGVTLAPGDKVSYEITPTIPNYGTEYTNATYTVADTLTNMTLSGDINVTGADKNDYTITKTDNSFTVTFNQAFLTNGSAKDVSITYNATLNASAQRGFGDNPNDVIVTYSNNPNQTDNTKTVEDHTHQYTFDIDGDINGEKSEQTKDIVKVGVDKKTGDVITTTKYGELTTTQTPLSGAQFTLTSKDGKVTKTVTTDKDGLMKITGLDAGDYTLKETKAPAGYKLDTTEVPVKISATLNEDGTLKSYAITINGTQTNTYTATYDGGVKTVAAANANADNKTSLFQNAKSSGLPATGGAGIFFYLIVGGALVALAVVLYTKNRKTQA
ncbi:SpaA isopeptide-forming pilin-related protein [Pseudoramibacter sp.]|jgi:fimbrial isopeptide formation D2 family protein/LPXTG-motif cell wall-anchored protein|uniref:SpaA isopeptide-forming pilin-related protein n=1 Tax=Pseudoramibacter sp. TaxID=2034862 RepID=UPI0025EE14DB|nr:SpaA isopeptide-forming pilin-related protein [Pseudoramibacter sp.]MCH4071976.1 isopeptide-forming domain-containing fimbrial protein [Pseudoramibacter sp.]MCH4105745.1 isopeptide-forming domain-containing fimbrial protein [Pseudoramibacter sp.]